MGHENGISDQQEQWQVVWDADESNGLTWGRPGPTSNTYAFAARSEYAREKVLTSLSDIASLPPEERTLCVESEFSSRNDGLVPLLQTYGIPKGSLTGSRGITSRCWGSTPRPTRARAVSARYLPRTSVSTRST